MASLYLIYERKISIMTFSDLEKRQHFIASYFINGLIQGMHVSYFIMSLKLKSGPMMILERLLALNCATNI